MAELIEDIGMLGGEDLTQPETKPAAKAAPGGKASPSARRIYIESYGCQMNFSDSEIVMSILEKEGFAATKDADDADLVLLNTCAIRDKAEQTIRHRLTHLNALKKKRPDMMIGVLGCMAERLKSKLLDEEKMVDMVVGPDAYRTLPDLVSQAEGGQKAVNVFLSREETYDDIEPVRLNTNGVTAFISIMRGCDNMCSFCVVPYTRGRERSRDPFSIVNEAANLFHKGYREVTLLGQNVDSYKWADEGSAEKLTFAGLLQRVAEVSPLLRVRFSTSHPKDMTDEVLEVMARHENICKYIHLPAQSGNTAVLDRMNRTYDREWYLDRVAAIRRILGDDCAISTDIITGFCGETEHEHRDTLSLMELVGYDYAYMFAYSERPGTPAARKMQDDIDEETKNRRLREVIEIQNGKSLLRKQSRTGRVHRVLVEGPSKRGNGQLCGRNDQNDMVVFDCDSVAYNLAPGTYVDVFVNSCSSATLLGNLVSVVQAEAHSTLI